MFQPVYNNYNHNHSNEEYIVVQKERSFRLARDVLGKPVIDRFGFKIGKVNDLAIANSFCKGECFPTVTGILVGKKFLSWANVKKIDQPNPHLRCGVNSHFTLAESLRRDDICPIPKDHMLLVKKILDEQLIDRHGRYIGRVDDIRLVYNIEEHALRVAGLYSGGLSVLMRIGVDVFGNVIPWTCVERIRSEKPTGIVLNFQRKTMPVAERYVLHEVRKI